MEIIKRNFVKCINMTKRFYSENIIITLFLIFALLIIGCYLLKIDCIEHKNAKTVFGLIKDLAIGYIVNFIFYVTQIYIPTAKKNKVLYARINESLNDIGHLMLSIFQEITREKVQEPLSEDFLNGLLRLRLDCRTAVADITRSNRDGIVFYTVRELLYNKIVVVNQRIDTLVMYYQGILQPDIISDLENIKKSQLHTIVFQILFNANDVRFSGMSNFYLQYYELKNKLLADKEKFYEIL